MLSVLLIWIMIFVTAGAVGLGVFTVSRYRPRRLVSYWLAGLIACTVYAETWSLFGGVGCGAFLTLLFLSAGILFLCRRECSAVIGRLKKAFSDNVIRTVLGSIAILLLGCATAQGNWHPDTPLYHAQAIRWIETYGAVRGLGNLQSHFAYNNACFPLYALYSFFWLGGQSYHAVQGFFASLLMILITDLLNIPAWKIKGGIRLCAGRGVKPSDALRLGAAVQILLLCDELVSPSSDCLILLIEHLLLILWMECVEDREPSPRPYAWLAMLAVGAVTVKLAAAPLLLLSLYPVIRLLKGDQRDPAVCGRFFLLGVGITVPFFVRGLLVSGWILYPALSQHVVRFPWQIPDGVGEFESFEIRQNGRMIFDMAEADTSLLGWFDAWLIRQPRPARILFYVALSAAVLVLLRILWETIGRRLLSAILRKPFSESPESRIAECFTELILAGSFVFWFYTTPQMRFGQGYLLLLSAAVYGRFPVWFLAHPISDRYRERWTAAVGVLADLAMVFFLALCVRSLLASGGNMTDTLIRQQDYDRYPMRAYSIDGIDLYCPTEFVYTGYYDFPATRWEVTDVRALGGKITDGFAVKE